MSDQRTKTAAELLTALREARDAVFTSAALREKNTEEALVSKRKRARALPLADGQSAADLDALFDLAAPRQIHFRFNVRWIADDQAKECRAAIRALPADRRVSLFKHLLRLKAWLGWDGELETCSNGAWVYEPEGDVRIFEKFCEGIMTALCETGFPVDTELATRTLDWLAHHCPQGYDLTNVAGRDYWKKSLGAVKAIAQAAADGMALPDAARRDALIVFDRYQGISADARDALLARGATLEPAAKALLDISGYGRQDTFFRRMQAIAPMRVAAAKWGHFSDADWALYLDFHREVRALVDDVKRAFADGFASSSWLSDPEAFRKTFEVSADEMNWPFWMCEGSAGGPSSEIMSRPGFAALRESDGLRRVAAPGFRPYTEAELEDFRRFARGEINLSPFTFGGKGAFGGDGVPDVAAFTFAGADPEGRFLDHLVSLEATKPSDKWLKTTDDHLARIGAEQALGGFARWLGHLQDISLDAVDWGYADEARMVFINLSQLRDHFRHASRHRSRPLALRRLALQSLWIAGIFVGPALGRQRSSGEDVRREAEHLLRRPLSEPCVAIARGVVWASSRIDDTRVPALLEAAGREFYKKFGDFRSQAAGNAVLWSLGQFGTLEAAHALTGLRRTIRDKSVAKLVDAALEAAGAKVGMSRDDMHDLATPDYGIGPDGTRTEMLGLTR
jgi:hypothetical protein